MNVIIKKNKEEIGQEIASEIINDIKKKNDLILGLATGSTPLPLYKSLITIAKDQNVSFSNIKTFNLDEYYGLDASNDQSYRFFMNKNLFKYLDFKKEYHNFPLVDNYEKYDEMIDQCGGIDIQILGIGENGHIAFNEPFTPLESRTHITNLTKNTIENNSRFFENINDVPTKAITMGLSTILKAKKIYLIATGENKSKAIKTMLEGKYVESCPASALNLKNDNVFIYLDESAAKLLG